MTPEPPDPVRSPVRHYGASEVGLLLVGFALTGVLFDSAGLVTWAGRLPYGKTQTLWLSVLEPVNQGLEQVGLTRVRQQALVTADQLAERLGAPLEEESTPAELALAESAPLDEPEL